VAESIIKLFPGESLAAKSSSALIATSIATYLISKEIYIIDAEFFEAICLFGAYYVWYSAGKETAASYFKDRKQVLYSDFCLNVY
jgi:F-type H+-transporting ATPase subunit b